MGVELLLGLFIALLLQKPTRFNNLASVRLLLPLITAPALAALMWKLMTNPSFGVLSCLEQLMVVQDFKWTSSLSSALFTVVQVDVWVYTPFIMVLLLAGLRSLPQQPFEAAALDGVPRRFVFFLFPIFWIFLMSFQTNEDILRIPPSLFVTPTLSNYSALITGKLVSNAGPLDIAFMHNLWNSVLLSTVSVAVTLVLGVPAAYAFARYKFPLSEDIAFTLLSFRFAPLLVLLPLPYIFRRSAPPTPI